MRKISRLWLALALGTLPAACGDDGGGSPMMEDDAGSGGDDGGDVPTDCTPPSMAPDPEGMSGPCCYRESNAERQAAPEFRLAGLRIDKDASPAALSNSIVQDALAQELDAEAFNWLFRLDGADGDGEISITTGYGWRDGEGGDVTFRFAEGDAPTDGGGDANRWNPATAPAQLSGETFMSTAADARLIVPIWNEDYTEVLIELPLRGLTLPMAEMSEERSCIGFRQPGGYTAAGEVSGYITVVDAAPLRIDIPPLNNYLCNFIAGIDEELGECTGVARGEWSDTGLPDSLCDGNDCERDPGDGSVCDPADDCNAWHLGAGIAAHGVDIE